MRGSKVTSPPFVPPDFQRDRGYAEPEEDCVLLHQQHHLLPGQKGAAHDRRGGSSAHPAHGSQLEVLRGADVAAADWIHQILPEIPGRALCWERDTWMDTSAPSCSRGVSISPGSFSWDLSSLDFSWQDHQVDGDILLRLTEEELQKDLGMDSSITRKR